MKRLLAVSIACAALGPLSRTGHAERTVKVLPRPPLDVVVPATLLVRGPSGSMESLPGARRVRTLGDGTVVLELDGAKTAEETIARRDALQHDHPELSVDLDLFRQGQAGPNDEGYPRQWALASVNALDAWAVTTGDPELVVAVVDTGYVDHPDFAGRIAAGYDFITDPGNAGDGDGRDPDPHDEGDERAESSGFHGPHVSGIIGATTNNGIGMAGVDWNCRIQPVRVLGVRGHRGKDSDIADGIRWAAGLNLPGLPINKTPARIINLSFGGPGFSRVLQDAVLAARDRGVMVIGSAGNSAADASDNVPSALEGVLSVAAAGMDGLLASYSNFGPRVDLMAPGGSLFLEAPSDQELPGAIWSTSYVRVSSQPVFAYAAGTSQAAAYASGVAALVRAAAPSLPPDVVGAVMRRASRLPTDGCPQGCGAGLIDAALAVTYAKEIEEASCGEQGCGATNRLAPAPLRPEEGCAVSPTGVGAGSSGGLIPLSVLAALAVFRRRAGAWLLLSALGLVGCGGGPVDRESSTTQSLEPPTVKIVDPVPTYEEGELSLSVGGGREIAVQVTPATALDRVEVVMMDESLVIGRLAHEPFRFLIAPWVVGESGRRLVCVIAHDAHAQQGESCFYAIP